MYTISGQHDGEQERAQNGVPKWGSYTPCWWPITGPEMGSIIEGISEGGMMGCNKVHTPNMLSKNPRLEAKRSGSDRSGSRVYPRIAPFWRGYGVVRKHYGYPLMGRGLTSGDYGCLHPVSYRPKRGPFMDYPSGSGPRDLGIGPPHDLT